MPIILKKGEIAIKDRTTGEYDKTINVVAEQTTDDMISGIQDEGNTQIAAVEAKGEETLDSIPDDYTQLSNDVVNLKKNNSINIVPDSYFTRTTATHNGATYTWNNNVCTITGAVPSNVGGSVNLLRSESALPSNIIPGKRYFLNVTINNNPGGVYLRLIFRDNNSATIGDMLYYTKDGFFAVPELATRWVVGLFIDPGTTFSGPCTVSGIEFKNVLSNTELFEKGLYSNISLPSGTDFNNVVTPGCYVVESTLLSSYLNCPLPSGNGGLLTVFNAGISGNICVQKIDSVNGRYSYTRTAVRKVFSFDWVMNNRYDTLESIDYPEYDRTSEIQAILTNNGVCTLGPGVYYIDGLEIPTYGKIKGCGANAKLILKPNATHSYAIKLNNYCSVSDLWICGSASSITPSLPIGNRHGILFEGNGDSSSSPVYKYSCLIDNCSITDFTGGGITCNNTGISVDQNICVNNCIIKRCGIGINVAYRSEFHQFSNISAAGCYYGCVCNGGNCLFTACNFSGNTVGVIIDNENSQSPNNAHGVFSCCKIAHSGNNTGIALKVIGSVTNENFNGIVFDYGKIIITNCQGIMFSGCRLGREVDIEVNNSTAVIFSSCIVRDATTNTVTSTNSSTHFINCFNSIDGNVYNPLGE